MGTVIPFSEARKRLARPEKPKLLGPRFRLRATRLVCERALESKRIAISDDARTQLREALSDQFFTEEDSLCGLERHNEELVTHIDFMNVCGDWPMNGASAGHLLALAVGADDLLSREWPAVPVIIAGLQAGVDAEGRDQAFCLEPQGNCWSVSMVPLSWLERYWILMVKGAP